MEQYVSGRELARRLGMSETMVRKYVSRGLFVAEVRGAHKGLFDAARCAEAYKHNRDPEAAVRGAEGAAAVSNDPTRAAAMPENSLTRVRTAHAAIKTQVAQLELQKAKGEVISKADALRAAMAVITIVRERLDGVPAQVAPRVIGLTSVPEIERVVREILDAARVEIRKMGDAIEAADAQS